jgi:hypothetical protein
LKKGYLCVEEAPAALKTLLGEVEINNELQTQLTADIEKDSAYPWSAWNYQNISQDPRRQPWVNRKSHS